MQTTSSGDSAAPAEQKTRAAGSSYRNIPDTRSISMLGLGLLLGAALGAGVALLAAPQSGEETRDRIRDRVRHVRGTDGMWNKLGRELRRATQVKRKSELARRSEQDRKMLDRERAERDAKVTPA